MAAANGVGGDGGVRPWLRASEGESQERGGRTEGVEASPGAGTGSRLSLQHEAGGGACVRGRFLTATAAALGRGEEDDRGERLVGWAAQELGLLGYQVSAR